MLSERGGEKPAEIPKENNLPKEALLDAASRICAEDNIIIGPSLSAYLLLFIDYYQENKNWPTADQIKKKLPGKIREIVEEKEPQLSVTWENIKIKWTELLKETR